MDIGPVAPLRTLGAAVAARHAAGNSAAQPADAGRYRLASIPPVGAGSLASAYKAIRSMEMGLAPPAASADQAETPQGQVHSERARSSDVVDAMRDLAGSIASAAGIAAAMSAYREIIEM